MILELPESQKRYQALNDLGALDAGQRHKGGDKFECLKSAKKASVSRIVRELRWAREI